jgi:hypothetical protein
VALLEPDGVPSPGSSNLYVSTALTTLTLTPVYEEGDEITEKNACGEVCVNYKSPPSLKRVDIALAICTPDPFLHAILVDSSVLLTDGDRRGWAVPPIGVVTGDGVSIELWAKRINDGDLDVDSPYAWWVLPKVKNIRIGERAFSNSALASPFVAEAYENSNWFDGPLNDWPVASDRAVQWFPTDSMPDAECAYATLAAS